MRTNKKTRAVVVGVFIFLGLAIFIATVLTLGGQKKTFTKSITIKAIFDDISGLQKGNNVWFSGVKIGTIKKISFAGNSMVEVDMSIEENAIQYIRKNSKARISQEGLIGNKIVVIIPGMGNSPSVIDGDALGIERAVNPDDMINTFQANNKNLLEITNDFKVLSRGLVEGRGTVGKLITDDELFIELQSTMAKMKRSADNAQRLSDDIAAYTSQLDRKGTLANELVTDTTIVRTLRSTIAQMQKASTNANEIVNNLNATSNNLNSSLRNTNTPAGMLLNDEQTAGQIKDILLNLQAGTKKMDENLEALQHNFLFRGYFKKKARQEEEAAKGNTP